MNRIDLEMRKWESFCRVGGVEFVLGANQIWNHQSGFSLNYYGLLKFSQSPRQPARQQDI